MIVAISYGLRGAALSRRSFVRARGLVLTAACAVALAGCMAEGGPMATFGPKHLQPVSAPTVALIEQKGMDKNSPILLRIFKEESELEIWKQNRQGKFALLKTYPICRWSGELGPKVREGDRQAPEGFYFITPELMNPRSSYYLAFNLGYPNEFDRAHGRTGAHLMVHGDCSSRGCYAMTDEQIQEIFALARESFDGGQLAFQVQAFPFRMTAKNMARHRNNPNLAFWRMLKEGSDHFELTKTQPKIDVCEKRYVFNAHLFDPSELFDGKSQCPAFEVPKEIASAVAAKKQADEREAAVLARLLPAAPIVTGRDGDTHQAFASGVNRPANTVVPGIDDGRYLASGGPSGGSITGSTNSSTAVIPTPPGDPRRSGGAATAASPAPGSTRASLGATNGAPRGRSTVRETPANVEPAAAQPAREQYTAPPALPGATPIRSSGGFSYR
jgi:murein L,D-transpeptidase YafK